uniref:Uncharacterized protein n=1 Tax=Panagrolaimus davidi TaxID=227884 RepID=A0A914P4N6_9BILA
MQNVRLSINRDDMTSVLKIDNRWHSYQSQPNNILMNFGVKNEEFCKNMTKQAKSDLAGFLSKIKLEFEFTMSTVQEEFRVLNITGKTIAKNEFFTELKNEYADKDGKIHLNSNDLNKLAHDIFRTVKITEAVTARYIKSDEENEIIGHLLNEIKGQEVG